jgi:hypothetical protein
MIKHKTTLQAVSSIEKESEDQNLKARYGTSVEEYMSREHKKELRQEINNLRNEFKFMNKTKNSYITPEELIEFLKSKDSSKNYDQDFVYKVYELLEKDPKEDLTIGELVDSYVFFCEKLKIKNVKIEKKIDELKEQINKDKQGLIRYDDEKERPNGLTNESSIYITVIEGQKLESPSLFSSICDSFVSLDFEGQRLQTKLKNNTNNPAWNENFKFVINNPDSILKVEVYDSTFLGNKLIGYLNLPIKNFSNQERTVRLFDLYNEDKKEVGKIRLKIQCIFSMKKYYNSQIEKASEKLNYLEDNYNMTNHFVGLINQQPFGILIDGNFEDLLNKNALKDIDKLINFEEEQKKFVFLSKLDDENGPSLYEKVSSTLNSTIKKITGKEESKKNNQ